MKMVNQYLAKQNLNPLKKQRFLQNEHLGPMTGMYGLKNQKHFHANL